MCIHGKILGLCHPGVLCHAETWSERRWPARASCFGRTYSTCSTLSCSVWPGASACYFILRCVSAYDAFVLTGLSQHADVPHLSVSSILAPVHSPREENSCVHLLHLLHPRGFQSRPLLCHMCRWCWVMLHRCDFEARRELRTEEEQTQCIHWQLPLLLSHSKPTTTHICCTHTDAMTVR